LTLKEKEGYILCREAPRSPEITCRDLQVVCKG
jgi:hypothetical protein